MLIFDQMLRMATTTKKELRVLLEPDSTEEIDSYYDRMVKISQGSTLSITNVTDIVSCYVRSGRGSVKDALHMLEESYGLLQEGNMLKRDCFFFQDYQDMGATVYTCDYYKQYGYCPCEECDKYVSKGTASNFIRDMVDSGNNPENEKAKDLFAYLSIQVFQKAADAMRNDLRGINKAFNAMAEAARDLKAKSDENRNAKEDKNEHASQQ